MDTLLCVVLCVGLAHFTYLIDVVNLKDVDKLTADSELEEHDSFTSLCESFVAVYFVGQDLEHAVSVTLKTEVAPQDFDGDSLNVVYVIGESYIKRRSALYGYSLPTTPCLDEERRKGNLFVFDDVITFSNQTSVVMKNTLCCNSLRYDEKWSDTPYFPALFKKSGYDVFLWDNQKEDGQHFYAFSLMSFMYNEELIRVSYSQMNGHNFEFDGKLVDDFARNSKQENTHQLVMFHLNGQHVGYEDRYPHEAPFNRFSAKDIKRDDPWLDDTKRQLMAHYDNATLYNDHVLGKIIDLYRDKNTVLVYFSDHGEECYDYRDSFGRGQFDPETQPEGLHCQFDVPFMIWCSDKYMERHPDVVDDIRQSVHKPFRTDEICHVLFHLSGLKTGYYRPECDLLSPQYVKYRRTVANIKNCRYYDAP